MSELGIFGIAYDGHVPLHHRYDAWGIAPQFDHYIESVFPETTQSYESNGNFVKIDTTDSDSVVIASEKIVLPTGEERHFSFWLLDSDANGTIESWKYKILPVHKGQFGLVGLYYGVPALPPIHKLQLRAFTMQQLVDKMLTRYMDLSKLEKEVEAVHK